MKDQQESQEWTAVIRPQNSWIKLNIQELIEYRELLVFLVWRDISVRYKQTVLGATWAIIQPVMTMIVFSIFFGKLANISSEDVPYPIFSYAALLPWTYFSNALSESANSLVGNSNLISKVYFPRLLIPMSTSLRGLVDFAIAFLVLIILMIGYGISPTWNILLLPLFLLMAIGVALAVGLWLSALNVQYRDVRYVVPFMVQFLLFATPIAYPSSLLDEPLRTLYGLNPMAGVVEGFRWALIGTPYPGSIVFVSATVTFALLIGGLLYFQRMEATFADVV